MKPENTLGTDWFATVEVNGVFHNVAIDVLPQTARNDSERYYLFVSKDTISEEGVTTIRYLESMRRAQLEMVIMAYIDNNILGIDTSHDYEAGGL